MIYSLEQINLIPCHGSTLRAIITDSRKLITEDYTDGI